MTAEEVFRRESLPIRARLLEIAAALDRIDRAPGEAGDEARLPFAAIRELLERGDADRAERIQRLYSREYDPRWRARFAESAGTGGA